MEIKQFNDKWEYTLFQLSETSKKIEDDLQKQHEQEMLLLEEEINAMGDPQIKFSGDLLDKKFKLKQLIKQKKYTEAKAAQEDIRGLEEKELVAMEENHLRAMEKLRENKRKKHKSEYESVKARLEKNINAKLKQRMNEYEKLLMRIQNVHNEMSSKQAREFKKIQSVHAKLLAKYSLNINDVVSRHNQIAEAGDSEDDSEEEPYHYNPPQHDIPPPYNRDEILEKHKKYGNGFASNDGEVLQNERIETLKNDTKSDEEFGERELEVEPVYEEEPVKAPKEEKVSDGETYTDEEGDTVHNLRNKVKNVKKKKGKKKSKEKEDATDLMDSKDLPNSFNNFYRVETTNFPTEDSEDSDGEGN